MKRQSSQYGGFRLLLSILILAAGAFSVSACSSGNTPASSSSSSAAPSSAVPAPSGPAPSGPMVVLGEAEEAAKTLKNYSFELKLAQQMTGESEASNSSAAVTMNGRVEVEPLKLDQQVKSVVDGETYEMRAILVPDAYYMYDPEFEEWSKTPKEQTAEIVGTLSDFQVNPSKALASMRAFGHGLKLVKSDGVDKITYEGNGPEARSFIEKILESTLDLAGMDPKVRESIKVSSLKVEFDLAADSHLPQSYRIESVMTVEYESGKPSTLNQTFSGSYGKPNAAEAVVVPDAAKQAPEIDPTDE